MANLTSSVIGVNLNASDATALFTLGQVVDGTNGAWFEYVEATATQTTGALVLINTNGTAVSLVTAKLTASAIGYDIGAVQFPINQGEFGWVARKGRSLYVKVTGTLTAGGDVGFSTVAGRLENNVAVGVGQTAFGIWITTGISGGTQATTATLLWPRAVTKQ